jgi:hypothetical protein
MGTRCRDHSAGCPVFPPVSTRTLRVEIRYESKPQRKSLTRPFYSPGGRARDAALPVRQTFHCAAQFHRERDWNFATCRSSPISAVASAQHSYGEIPMDKLRQVLGNCCQFPGLYGQVTRLQRGKWSLRVCRAAGLHTSNQRWAKRVGLLQPHRKFSTSMRSLPV